MRILPERRLRDGRDLCDGLRNVDRRLKENLNHRDPVQRLRLGVVDIVDGRRQAALEGQHNAVG